VADVVGRIEVGVLSEAARPAGEDGLGRPIGFGDVMAAGAFPAGVRRIDMDHRDSGPFRLVGNKGAELVERPGV
jgi:hypothetical protein